MMPATEELFAGVDGGATKTVCVISDSAGNLRGHGWAGPSNSHNVGMDRALRAISTAVKQAVNGAGADGARVRFACFGLAGLDSPLDFKRMERGLRSLQLARRARLVHDTTIALTGALGGEPGVIVIAGTGSVAGGVDSRGRAVRVGGWGAIIDDEGSAYDIGRRALMAALRAHDGRERPTLLLRKIMERIGTRLPEGIIEEVYIRGMGVSEIGALSRIVFDLGSKGDRVACRILREAGATLAELAIATADKLRLGNRFMVAPVGGVFSRRGIVNREFSRRLHQSAPGARVISPKFPPVVGSLIIALREGGVRVSPPLLARLLRGLSAREKTRM